MTTEWLTLMFIPFAVVVPLILAVHLHEREERKAARTRHDPNEFREVIRRIR